MDFAGQHQGGRVYCRDIEKPAQQAKNDDPGVPGSQQSNVTGPVAQRLEQWTHNPLVVGSNPTGPNCRLFKGKHL